VKSKTVLQKAHDLAYAYAKALNAHANGPNKDAKHVDIKYFAAFCSLPKSPAIIRQAKQLVHIYRK